MKPYIVTKGIVLSRIDFQEADRIITVLTPDHGKLRLIAKGVRRPKSKLAGGIELFSVSSITYTPGRGEIGVLVSSKLEKHYGDIVRDITRVQLGYELLKSFNKITEYAADKAYFGLLVQFFDVLNSPSVQVELIQLWCYAQVLSIGGMAPNLHSDKAGKKLLSSDSFQFDYDSGSFSRVAGGTITVNHIKFLRLLFSDMNPTVIEKVADMPILLSDIRPIVIYWHRQYIQ